MNIVILDKLAFTGEQVARLEKIGNVVSHDDFPNKDVAIERLKDADIVINGWTTLTAGMLEQASRLKYLALAQTGYEYVDLQAAKAQNVSVSNVPGYSRQSVAEYAFALLLAAVRHIPEADRQVRSGNVLSPTDDMLGYELYGKTLGILGLGSIGSWVGKIGIGFGMQIIGHSRAVKNIEGIEDVSLDDLLGRCDILIVTIDTNSSTTNLLSAEKLQTMKAGSILINITSNQVLDEDSLAELLKSGHVRCAAFDDLSHSGFDDDRGGQQSPLVELNNVVLSPQAGWYTEEAESRLLELTIQNVENYVKGEPTNLIVE